MWNSIQIMHCYDGGSECVHKGKILRVMQLKHSAILIKKSMLNQNRGNYETIFTVCVVHVVFVFACVCVSVCVCV